MENDPWIAVRNSRTIEGEIGKGGELTAQPPDDVISGRCTHEQSAEQELEAQTPEHRSPVDLKEGEKRNMILKKVFQS